MLYLRSLFAPCASLLGTALLFATPALSDISTDRKAELRNFLEQDCGSCHGLQRKGGLGSPLVPERLSGMDDETLADIILNGIPETAMPPWKAIIAEEEAYFLIKQLRDGLEEQ